jgi:pimeloyl-ACP methyl ester carboxylesterase
MDEIDVAVAGGALRVVVWPGRGPLVLAVHGITANALSWQAVARALAGRVRLVAPDLRGRAHSAHLPGPFGLAAHAADLVAVADHLGAERFSLVGHSMGGFVVTETAARRPDRVDRVLLVDGGVPLALPPGVDVDTALLATIGPAMQRLSMTFPALADYESFFRKNPALGRHWSPDLAAYVRRDYTGRGSSCNIDAVRADARDMITRPAPHDFPLLWAPRGLQDEETGLYRPDQLSAGAEPIPDANHYSILFGDAGARRIAEVLTQADT